GPEGLATMGQSSERARAGAERYAGEAAGPRLCATSQSVMGFAGVLSALFMSGRPRSSRPSPSKSARIGLARVEVGAGMEVATFWNPAARLWYEKRVGGLQTPSVPHSSICVRSVRPVVGPSP